MMQFARIVARTCCLACMLVAIAPGCASSSRDVTPLRTDDTPKATLSSRREWRDGLPVIIIDIHALPSLNAAYLDGLGRLLARHPGAVTVGDVNVNLPESEGFIGVEVLDDGVIVHRQGHDPALSSVTKSHWIVTIPVRSPDAKAACAVGMPITLHPDHCDLCRSTFRGMQLR